MEELKSKRYVNSVFSFNEEEVICLLYSIEHTMNDLILDYNEQKIMSNLQKKLRDGARKISKEEAYELRRKIEEDLKNEE